MATDRFHESAAVKRLDATPPARSSVCDQGEPPVSARAVVASGAASASALNLRALEGRSERKGGGRRRDREWHEGIDLVLGDDNEEVVSGAAQGDGRTLVGSVGKGRGPEPHLGSAPRQEENRTFVHDGSEENLVPRVGPHEPTIAIAVSSNDLLLRVDPVGRGEVSAREINRSVEALT